MYRQMETEHERSRKILAIELIQKWSSDPVPNARLCIDFVSSLEYEQFKSMYDREDTVLEKESYSLLGKCLRELSDEAEEKLTKEDEDKHKKELYKEDGGKYIMTGDGSSEVIAKINKSLNKFETVLTAYVYKVANEDIIGEQFAAPVHYSNVKDVYGHVRNLYKEQGKSDPYPSIGKFIERYQSDGLASYKVIAMSNTMVALYVFVLACFIGYFVIWGVTPSLHTPLISLTNAISGIIIVGALLVAGFDNASGSVETLGFLAVLLASINIFGGFWVTQRMLAMFKKK